jgi:hypothetical protein
MNRSYSSRVLAGLTGTNPRGVNTSLLDLVHGKSISFDRNNKSIVLFIVFKTNLFVYLKHVGLLSTSQSNVKRIRVDYIDENQLLIRTQSIDYSTNQTRTMPVEDVSALKITIEETYDGRAAENVRLTVRGCFGIRRRSATSSTVSTTTTTATTTPSKKTQRSFLRDYRSHAFRLAPCHHINLMSNRTLAAKIVAYVAGTNPISSSIFDYFQSSTMVSYNETRPTLIVLFKSNIYVDLKSISLTNNQSNVREYQIDLFDQNRTIVQTIVFNQQLKQSIDDYHVPISALQITYLNTIDGQSPRNIQLNIVGCFGIDPSMPIETTTSRPIETTMISTTTTTTQEEFNSTRKSRCFGFIRHSMDCFSSRLQ